MNKYNKIVVQIKIFVNFYNCLSLCVLYVYKLFFLTNFWITDTQAFIYNSTNLPEWSRSDVFSINIFGIKQRFTFPVTTTMTTSVYGGMGGVRKALISEQRETWLSKSQRYCGLTVGEVLRPFLYHDPRVTSLFISTSYSVILCHIGNIIIHKFTSS